LPAASDEHFSLKPLSALSVSSLIALGMILPSSRMKMPPPPSAVSGLTGIYSFRFQEFRLRDLSNRALHSIKIVSL